MQSLGFAYDTADRVTEVGNGIHPGYTQNFGYDAMSRLVSVYSSTDSESFQYDANGNRMAQTGVLNTYSATSNRLVSSGGTQYGYDAKGNTITVNAAPTYHYDAFNRMDSAGGMTYYVNPEGQRLRKSGAAGTTYFAPGPGGALLAEYANGAWVDYVWLNGRLIGRIANGQAYAIHVDQTGRPEAVTDASRTVVWQAQNLAFTRNVTVASITLNLGFPGQYYDGEIGKWNNGYRDYDAELGRYVESDPVGLGGGVNTYAYAGNNPTNNFDPLGLYCLKEWQIQGLAGAVVGAGLGAAAGSESGPGALVTGVVGALINGGIGVASGLMTNNQSSGAAAGAAGALVSSGSKIDLAGGIYGGTLGGVVSSQMQNKGYSRTTANAVGGVAGGSVGSAVSGYLSGLSVPDIAKSGVKGGLIGVAVGLSQSGLEAALRSGNDCSCGK